MAGPWERYQREQADGPWSRFQRQAEPSEPSQKSQPSQIDDYYSSGIFAGAYNPLGAAARSLDAATTWGGDALTLGFGDEIVGGDDARSRQRELGESNPVASTIGAIGGGAALGAGLAPLSASNAAAQSGLGLRALAGVADGGILGGLYGFGSGEDMEDRVSGAALGAGIGGVVGGALPLAGAGIGRAYEATRNAMRANPIARQAGTTPEALRTLGGIIDADGSLSSQGGANMARAGQEAMLADAGPTARRALDTAIQRSGPGGRVARRAIDERVARDAAALTGALDDTLGRPGESMSRELVVYGDRTNPLNLLYKRAYETPIDYAKPAAREIEQMVKTRVPPEAIRAANNLMRTEGVESRQILANIADDGSIVFERLPDVRQLDYITRGLNQVAQQADGQGALGGTTPIGRAYGNLSRDIRSRMKDLVPEYKAALDRAGTEIGKVRAQEFGGKLLSPSTSRDQVREFVTDLPQAEKQKLVQGVRQQIDDAMARVTRTVADGDVPAREAVQALKNLSSRANREKLTLAIGEEPAKRLFREIDRAAQSFDLRSAVADNSATYARQAMQDRIRDLSGQGGIYSTAAQGEPLNATRRIVQLLTGETPARIAAREDALYAEMARLLTMQGGPSRNVYNAINQIGQTDYATQLMRDRIVRALAGPHLAYPAGSQLQHTQR